VRVEANDARERGILVPALLDEVKVPLAFRGIQTANLVHWRGGPSSPEFDELRRAIAETLASTVQPASTEAAAPAPAAVAPTRRLRLPNPRRNANFRTTCSGRAVLSC
jgi:hypothetical protein